MSLAVLSMSVKADHDTTVTISPDIANCEQVDQTYTVTVGNDGGSSSNIREVRIYTDSDYDGDQDENIANFDCGSAPSGWTLDDRTTLYNYCQYETTLNGPDDIEPGHSLDFTFDAIFDRITGCDNKFRISTIDDEAPIGDVVFKTPEVKIDCTDPQIIKNLGSPKISCESPETCDYWITQNTNIEIIASDDQSPAQCDLGLDYCEYRVEVDGRELFDWTEIEWDNVNDPQYFYDFKFGEDSEHFLEIQCYDIAGNIAYHSQTDKVDTTPPTTTKEVSEPKKVVDGVEWVDTTTTIEFFEKDGGSICHIDGVTTYYYNEVFTDPDDWTPCYNPGVCQEYADRMSHEAELWTEYPGGPLNKERESCHVLYFYSEDAIGNEEPIQTNCFFVDKTPPMIIKDNGDALPDGGEPVFTNLDNPEGEFHWITKSMPVTFTCDDSSDGTAPHPSGDEQLCYKVSFDEAPGTLSYITQRYCADPLDGEGYCCVDANVQRPFVFKFLEESMHNLEYYCVDAVEKKSEVHTQYYKVDDTPPSMTKDMFGSFLGDCPSGTDLEHGDCYVADNGESGVTMRVQDEGEICAVGVDYCTTAVWWFTDEQMCIDKYGPDAWSVDKCLVENIRFTDELSIYFDEDSTHKLYTNCVDKLGNRWDGFGDVEFFLVDSTPPVTTKTYGEPHYPGDINVPGPYPHWITIQTPITLAAEDEKVGVDQIYWRYIVVDNRWCNSEFSGCQSYDAPIDEQFIPYDDTVRLPEESCHLIEFYSVDLLGNEEGIKRQCVYVENTPPETRKVIGEPQVTIGDDLYISRLTPITMYCEDLGEHPVDHVTLFYRTRYADVCGDWTADNWGPTQEYRHGLPNNHDVTGDNPFLLEYVLYLQEDSCHELEYWCEDALGNVGPVKSEIDIVDTQAPNIEIEVEGPQILQACPGERDQELCLYIDGVTELIVNATDPEPHPVNEVTCNWDYDVLGGEKIGSGAQDVVPPFVINFPEESEHLLWIECEDKLGNAAFVRQTYIVDKTPPLVRKWYGQPWVNNDRGVEWITSDTPIFAEAIDPQPHPSGVREVSYRTTRVDDEYCYNQRELCESATGSGNFTALGESFKIDEDSCHLIEIMAVDNVEKETTHKQCVFVDNQAPDPVKTVGEPKSTWNGADANFYNISNLCWADGPLGIDCWKVTLLTPLNLACEDPQPHPVDHNTVCFKVEVDGDDYTQNYCGDRRLNDQGYCCMDSELPTFTFREVSEHNLAYYCQDALGNTGPLDDEKFKVEETAFRIQLNKKWNLISTPVKLLDDSMDEVFDDVAESVVSVWAFDGTDWFVYTPNGDDTDDNLDTMVPGDGYWVLAEDDDMLIIGGSLFSPAVTPPSKDIVHGWNLIGYFGAENAPEIDGMPGYYGPAGNGKEAGCAMYSIGDSIWDKGFASLWSYWEPYNPDLWLAFDRYSNMDPGAGYWVFATEEGEYIPTTVCGGLIV
ncbi:hypothetical protein GOV04_00340 [Candidatus Woesearchaeota archaeon]|nr:hypothetical protein [Candidatus Woesearchaeota archaeon]